MGRHCSRVERPNGDILLIQDLNQRSRSVNILVSLRIELDALPRIDHLIACDVRIVERPDHRFGLCSLGAVDGIGEDERSSEAAGGVLASEAVPLNGPTCRRSCRARTRAKGLFADPGISRDRGSANVPRRADVVSQSKEAATSAFGTLDPMRPVTRYGKVIS